MSACVSVCVRVCVRVGVHVCECVCVYNLIGDTKACDIFFSKTKIASKKRI